MKIVLKYDFNLIFLVCVFKVVVNIMNSMLVVLNKILKMLIYYILCLWNIYNGFCGFFLLKILNVSLIV